MYYLSGFHLFLGMQKDFKHASNKFQLSQSVTKYDLHEFYKEITFTVTLTHPGIGFIVTVFGE